MTLGKKRLIVGIDTGGTFTDCVYRVGGRLTVLKLPSTPEDPGRAILNAIDRIVEQVGPAFLDIRHGTTVATNALLERKGARVAFVTTEGFEDTLAIGRQATAEPLRLESPQAEAIGRTGVLFRSVRANCS